MNTPHEGASSLVSEILFQIQIKIARRADEIVQQHGRRSNGDLIAWAQAEREVLVTGQTGLQASGLLLVGEVTLE
jgi:hypothetical protein